MSRIRIGDTVAFRRQVVARCGGSQAVAAVRGVVTDISGEWIFITDANGAPRVMPAASMCKVARNGLILELV